MLEGKSVYLIVNSTETHTERRTPRATKDHTSRRGNSGSAFQRGGLCRKFWGVQAYCENLFLRIKRAI